MISSAGRRVGLVRSAKAASERVDGRVVATDVTPGMSAACLAADEAFEVPSNDSPDFLPALLQIAKEHEVGLLIPTLDTELMALAGVREAWLEEGISISVPDPDFVARCRDKRETMRLFDEMGVPSPKVIEDDLTFPRFVKPLDGSLSKDIHEVMDPAGYDARWANTSEYLNQELVDSARYTEFTVDLLYGSSGSLVCLVPRRRMEVRGGEVSKGRTQREPLLPYLRERMETLAGVRGCLTAQFFVADDWANTPDPVLGIEINPRFGGGYPLTDQAGGRYVEWLLDEVLTGSPRSYTEDWSDSLTMLRYDEAFYV